MALEHFDEHMRGKLGGVKVPPNDRWTKLDERLETSIDREAAFDDLVAGKLRGSSVQGPARSWAAMEKTLGLRASRTSAFIKAKFLETAMLLLIVWFLGQWGDSTPSEPFVSQQFLPYQERVTGFAHVASDNAMSGDAQSANRSNTPMPIFGGHAGKEEKTAFSVSSTVALHPFPLLKKDIPVAVPVRKKISPVPVLGNPLPVMEIEESNPIVPFDFEQKDRAEFCLGIYSTFDYNFISSPFDIDLQSQPYRRYRPGYGGGLQIAFIRKSLEIATGLGYSVKSYEPRRIDEVLGDPGGDMYTDALREIELSVMTLPIHFKYRMTRRGRWSAYLLGGGAMHLVMTAGYDRTQPIADNRFLPPSFAPEARPLPDQFSEASIISQKSYDEGLFEGGNLKDNSIFTLNAGLGMEYLASSRVGVFAEPIYQQLLFGKQLGPTQDRISTFSIQLGLRMHIH